MSEASRTTEAPLIWTNVILFTATFLVSVLVVPVYGVLEGYSLAAWISLIVLFFANGLSITGGYHRLWAHRAYEAHWSVRLVLMLFGTMALQNSILVWASGHRTHHRHVDDIDQDPYSAKRGFWFSHIGWMLREYPSGVSDFSNARDLLDDRMVMFQHKYYVPLTILMNVGLPALIGWAVGDFWGVILLGGFLRLVLSHHVTFFINSLAHMWGSQPYTDENTARDNPVLALFTHGEGYHNYHHIFQYDYRNGIKWWQYDPTKWLVYGLSLVGLTSNLKRCDDFAIRRAMVTMQFKRAQAQIEAQPSRFVNAEALKQAMAAEYERFSATLAEFGKLKEEWYAAKKLALSEKKAALSQKWAQASFRTRFKEIDYRLKMQSKRLRQLMAVQVQTA